jgi:hypothetical protein
LRVSQAPHVTLNSSRTFEGFATLIRDPHFLQTTVPASSSGLFLALRGKKNTIPVTSSAAAITKYRTILQFHFVALAIE